MNAQVLTFGFRSRARAALVHLAFSAAVAAAAAGLVFGLWYRWPYRVVSGGQGIFLLLIAVDIVLGPLLTACVFDQAKSRRQLRNDLAVIVLIQLAALFYGLFIVYQARPVALVFEQDRFRVVTASDVRLSELPMAPEAYRVLPLSGPWVLGTRRPRDGAERNDALFLGLNGVDIGQRPSFWQPYEQSKVDALARSRPVARLLEQYPAGRAEIEATLRKLNLSADEVRFLPLVARLQWVVLLSKAGDVVGFAPFDGFF